MNNSPRLHSYNGDNYPDIYAFRIGCSIGDLRRGSLYSFYDAGYCLDALDIAPAGSAHLLSMKNDPPVIRNSIAWIR